MNQKILLIEPNYKNKYPPMGLMKLATYYRNRGDDVRFFKGDLKVFAAKLLCEEFLAEVKDPKLGKHVPKFIEHIKTGKFAPLDAIPNFRNSEQDVILKEYRLRYRNGKFPQFDVIGITTLFTFYWRKRSTRSTMLKSSARKMEGSSWGESPRAFYMIRSFKKPGLTLYVVS